MGNMIFSIFYRAPVFNRYFPTMPQEDGNRLEVASALFVIERGKEDDVLRKELA